MQCYNIIILQVDIFSYGVMLVHVLSGEWPFPEEAVRVNPNNPNDLVGVTEFNRRETYINKIDNHHPLMHLIQLCLSNSSLHRPTSCEVYQQVSAVSAEHPASFTNRVEMFERIKALGEEKEAMTLEKSNAVAIKDEQIAELRREKEQVSAKLEETQSTIERLQQLHSIELERVQLEVFHLKADNEHLRSIVNEKDRELHTLENNLVSEVELLIESHEKDKQAWKKQLSSLKEESVRQLTTLQEKYHTVKRAMEIQAHTGLNNSEYSSQVHLISNKCRTTQEKLGRTLETSLIRDNINEFAPGMKRKFTECAKIPPKICGFGQAITIGKQVYVGSYAGDVFKYNITKDAWSTLPKAPIMYFTCSVGYVRQKSIMLLVGGQLQSNLQVIDYIYKFDESTQQWVKSTCIPPMPTARKSVTAVSWTSPPALIVCGGSDQEDEPMTVVEVYHSGSSQWHTVSPLPFPRDTMTHTVIHDKLFLVGGFERRSIISYTKTVISASIPQLLESCLQPSKTLPAQWQSNSIPDVPHYWSTATSLDNCLLVMGGSTESELISCIPVSSVHAYCPSSSSWECVGELPQPLAMCITATLPTGELLVMGDLASYIVSQHKFSITT